MVEPFPPIIAAPSRRGRRVRHNVDLIDAQQPAKRSQAKPGPWLALFAVGVTMLIMWVIFAIYGHLARGRDWSHAFHHALVPAIVVGTTELLASVFEFVRRRVTRHSSVSGPE